MVDDCFKDVIEVLNQIEVDFSVPKNVREKVKNATSALCVDDCEVKVKIDRSLQELDDISDDPNVPSYTKMQIWNVVSLLESI